MEGRQIMNNVLVCGIMGRMGSCSAEAIAEASDLNLCGGVDVGTSNDSIQVGDTTVPVYSDLAEALGACTPDVMLDFTSPSVVEGNIRTALAAGVSCVVGTTGLSEEQLADIYTCHTGDAKLFVAPNFTTGAVLMMQFSKMAARFFPDAEVIELHHDHKKDAPSGTAIRTARMIAEAKELPTTAPGRETELEGMEGARGALIDGIPVHSVRTDGYVAHQEVIFGSSGQTLTIRHDSIDRASYMPGVLLALRKIHDIDGLVIGLENLMAD
jgi:4-hydroxy-tetrahydrodipicolinate reductase